MIIYLFCENFCGSKGLGSEFQNGSDFGEPNLTDVTFTISLKFFEIHRLILMPESKHGRPPLTLRLTMFFDCRSPPRNYLLELILNPPTTFLLL
ncbi:hypothetical protein Hanom_Chr04g00331691 [Helianthus anomalus]